MLATPGLTASEDPDEARRVLLDDALRRRRARARASTGRSWTWARGGGTPGIPLAVALPEREVTLLEAERRKSEFLERWTGELPNLRVVWGRAEEQPTDAYGVAVAKALAPPPVAAEWCLPLVAGRRGDPLGRAVGGLEAVAAVAGRLAAAVEESPPGFVVLRKMGPTPAGFPRRPGMARKRPLA